MEAGVMMSGR